MAFYFRLSKLFADSIPGTFAKFVDEGKQAGILNIESERLDWNEV